MRKWFWLAFWSAFAATVHLVPGAALANAIREMSLKEKVDRSSVVIIGKATGAAWNSASGLLGDEYEEVSVVNVLKGSPPNTVLVLRKGMIAEEDPDCYTEGMNYLFFLRSDGKDRYSSVNGHFGIVRAQ